MSLRLLRDIVLHLRSSVGKLSGCPSLRGPCLTIEHPAGGSFPFLRGVGVPHGHVQAPVSEEFLHGPSVHSAPKQDRCDRMSKTMVALAIDVEGTARTLEHRPEAVVGPRSSGRARAHVVVWLQLAAPRLKTILGQVKPAQAREFYILAAIKSRWSSRELERQIATGAALRSAPSTKKVSPVLTQIHPTALGELKNAYSVEFLSISDGHSEADLHGALLRNLGRFITELGRDFCFVGSEYPVQVGTKTSPSTWSSFTERSNAWSPSS